MVDSAGPACGGDPESAASVINYFTALRSLRLTSLTVAHRSKSGSVGPFGSVYWVNYPRATFELKKAEPSDKAIMDVAMIHRKVNEGSLLEPMAFRFNFQPGVVTVKEQPMADVPGFTSELPINEQLIGALEEQGACTAKELAEITGLNLGTIQVVLSRDAHFKRVGSNRWDTTRR